MKVVPRFFALREVNLSFFALEVEMKTFQVKQKMWSLGGKFTITDELGIPTYLVEGSFFKIPKSFTISDMQGNLVSKIDKQFMTFLPKFDVILADGRSFTIKKEFTFFKPRYTIEGLGIEVQGNIWDMDFVLRKNGQEIARISQEWLRMTSTYNVEVYEDSYADLVISLVIAIDYVKEQQAASSSASN